MIFVENKRTYRGGDGVYIGRPSPFGNPYAMKTEADRPKVIAEYKRYFYKKLAEEQLFRDQVLLLTMIASKKDLHLVCWCAPLPCHGDVIKEFINLFISGKMDIGGKPQA